MSDRIWSLKGCLLSSDPDSPVRIDIVRGCLLSVGKESREGGPLWSLPPDVRILPGFLDGHTHLLGVGLAALHPDLASTRSAEEALESTSAWLESNPGDSPVVAHGWDQSVWDSPRLPCREDLDRIAPRRPLVLRRVCGHVAVLNSAALAATGTDWPDLNPETGLALESLPLALARLWPPTAEQLQAAVRIAQEKAWSRGITGVQDMGHTGDALPFRALARADTAGELALRIHYFFGQDLLDTVAAAGLVPGLGSDRLRVGGIKLFLDGSFGGRSAAMREPYPGTEEFGLLLWRDDDLLRLFLRASEAGFPLAIHAIGDRAIDQAIRCAEAATSDGCEAAAPGPRLEHAEALDEGLMERAARAGFRLSMQPNFTARWQGQGELYESVLGPERALRLNPYRSAAARLPVHFGSDCMPMTPLLGLRGALAHPDPEERMSLLEAVRRYTECTAAAVANPFHHGRIEEGAAADLVLLRLPALKNPEDAVAAGKSEVLDGAEVLGTIFDGRLRYRHPDLDVSGRAGWPE